jgi:BirA family biotin operon repressor/biotin-[acetyl-CoA-carboxylase] ligase
VWHSSPGENLLFSVLLRPQIDARRMPPVTLAVGVGVMRALVDVLGDAGTCIGLKWPNDVVTKGDLRKVAGVLVESSLADSRVDALVVGVGINVNQMDFQETIRSRATSLAAIGGRPFARGVLLTKVLTHVDACVDAVCAHGLGVFQDELAQADALVGRKVRSSRLTGVASGISPGGALLLKTASGMAEIGSGEVDVV